MYERNGNIKSSIEVKKNSTVVTIGASECQISRGFGLRITQWDPEGYR